VYTISIGAYTVLLVFLLVISYYLVLRKIVSNLFWWVLTKNKIAQFKAGTLLINTNNIHERN
jgi:hypothetical protein